MTTTTSSSPTETPVRVLSPSTFTRVFAAERERALRSEIEATLVVFTLGNTDAREFVTRIRCRETDYVGLSHDGDVLVLLWNTSAESAEQFVDEAATGWAGEIEAQTFPLIEDHVARARSVPVDG